MNSPVLVEAPFALVADVLGEDGLEGSETTGGVDVAHHTDHDHGGSLHDGDGLYHLLLVDLCRSKRRGEIKDVADIQGLTLIWCCSEHDIQQGTMGPLCPPVGGLIKDTITFLFLPPHTHLLEPGRSTSRTMCVMPAL